MRILCEVVVSEILPTLRSLITQELVQSHKLSQVQVSKMLGITQPAVSQYKRGIRGSHVKKILSNKKIMNEIKKFSNEIATKKFSPIDVHVGICRLSEKLIQAKIFSNEEINPGPCIIEGERFGK